MSSYDIVRGCVQRDSINKLTLRGVIGRSFRLPGGVEHALERSAWYEDAPTEPNRREFAASGQLECQRPSDTQDAGRFVYRQRCAGCGHRDTSSQSSSERTVLVSTVDDGGAYCHHATCRNTSAGIYCGMLVVRPSGAVTLYAEMAMQHHDDCPGVRLREALAGMEVTTMPDYATGCWTEDYVDTERLIQIIRAIDTIGFVIGGS